MPIRVTCTKCHARFNVSEKFAGKEGPCPKCKAKIRVPLPSEEVTIAAPKSKGPTDTKGRAIVEPILRADTSLSSLQITLLVAGVIGFLLISLVMQFMIDDWHTTAGWALISVGAFVVAVPLIFVAYALFRDQEREGFVGTVLGKRVVSCAALYAVAWMMLPLAAYVFNDKYEIGSYVLASVGMFAVGTVAAMACFEFDWLMGTVHYGLYFGVALLGRVLAGLPVFPVNPEIAGPGGVRTSWIWDHAVEQVPRVCQSLAEIFW